MTTHQPTTKAATATPAKRAPATSAATTTAPKRTAKSRRVDLNTEQSIFVARKLREKNSKNTHVRVPCYCPKFNPQGGTCPDHPSAEKIRVGDYYLPSSDPHTVCQLLDKSSGLPYIPLGVAGDYILTAAMSQIFLELPEILKDNVPSGLLRLVTAASFIRERYFLPDEQYPTRLPLLLNAAALAQTHARITGETPSSSSPPAAAGEADWKTAVRRISAEQKSNETE